MFSLTQDVSGINVKLTLELTVGGIFGGCRTQYLQLLLTKVGPSYVLSGWPPASNLSVTDDLQVSKYD